MKGTGARTLPKQDTDRQAALQAYGLLSGQDGTTSPPIGAALTGAGRTNAARTALDNLVDLAAKLCGVPFSVVNVITADQQRQIAASGVEPGICSREDSMCARVFLTRETTVVRDASEDPRFANNPFVTGEIAAVRFYASVPLETASGFVLGSLCVFSDEPASPEPEQIAMLELLAQQTVELLELQHRTLQLNVALDEVRRSNAKLGEFAGRVSHDLRIPLTTILGYVELSEDDPDMQPEHPAAEYLQLIGASGRRMLAMLEDVLDYSKVGGALHPQPVSLRGAAADAARDLGIPFGAGATLDSDDAQLHADPLQLRALLQNLLSNALNYRSPERPLEIRISAVSNYHGTAVLVADNGKGIRPEDRQRVLEPLVRLHREGDGPGSGLGLATCRRIAQAHGGDLTLTETRGGGTTVVLTFPAAP
ncbi:putative two-component histidine kinase [Arthrobacter globiformis NBRC 12137]|uniref:Sensor-like histidine kinase SenX3 n=1 Tax=Arthrobacter globiformis (strain ATCC 8010 / DSM 20124 / JCM 1332 / NBRC 12137 / NCIMB 8907 / NRRL B-2979 / 168) TaxID=1077972 RepID=H0QNU5_ARTG1|nr:GAF domain-containing sensor histidine kinase [Arthrobacter globiformis]GAB14496.1 putative two-component histidine kinase [Arthrobacter globiformis NBRC 12137]